MTNEVDIGSITNDRKLELLPPSDPRVQSAIAPFTDDMLSDHHFKDRKELSEVFRISCSFVLNCFWCLKT